MRSIFPTSSLDSTWRLLLRRLLGWHAADSGLALRAIVAATGMGIPLVAGYLTGRFPLGLGIALGCMSIQTPFRANSLTVALLKVPALVLPALFAAVVALMTASIPSAANWIFWGSALMASLSARYSRSIAIAATRFLIYVFIFGNALLSCPIPVGLFALICLGICWMSLVTLIASTFESHKTQEDASAASSPMARLRRMRRELKTLSCWDYPARLTFGIALTLYLQAKYPAHHFYWASLTVLLCTPRQFEAWPIRAAQRALGTLIGVVAAQLLSVFVPGSTTVLLALIALSFARRWFDEHSYLLYSAVMAPLILFLMGPEKMVSSSVASDRLLATTVGALVVLIANLCATHTTARTLPHKKLEQQIRATD